MVLETLQSERMGKNHIVKMVYTIILIIIGACIGEYSHRQAQTRQHYQRARRWVNLGTAYRKDGDTDKARDAWMIALTHPKGNGYYHYLAYKNLAMLAHVEGDTEQSKYFKAKSDKLKLEEYIQ